MKRFKLKKKQMLLKVMIFSILIMPVVDLPASKGRASVKSTSRGNMFGTKSKIVPEHEATMAKPATLAEQTKQQLVSKKASRVEATQIRKQQAELPQSVGVPVEQGIEFTTKDTGYQPVSFASYVKSSAPVQYIYHLPGEMSAQVGGRRNIIFDKPSLQLGKESTNPYLIGKKDNGFQAQSLLSSIKSSAPVQYAYHLPGEMSVQVGGPRNLIYDRTTGQQVGSVVGDTLNYLTGKESTHPYTTENKVEGYQAQSLLSSIAASTPAQYAYHLPGEMSAQVGGPRNLIYDRTAGQQVGSVVGDTLNSLAGKESTHPYTTENKVEGYQAQSLLSSIAASTPAQYAYHLPGEMSAQVGGPRNLMYDRSSLQTVQEAGNKLIGVESTNPYLKSTYNSVKVVPVTSGGVPFENYQAVAKSMLGEASPAQVSMEVSPYNLTGIPDKNFEDLGRALHEQSVQNTATTIKLTPPRSRLSVAEQEQRFLTNRAAKQAAKDRGMTGNLSRFNV